MSQAVQRSYLLCLRGPHLPLISGWFGGLSIVSHPLTGSDDNVWLVAPPIDDAQTTLGPDDLRFEPKVDPAVVRDLLDRLFDMSPSLEGMAPSLRWSCYAARQGAAPDDGHERQLAGSATGAGQADAFGLDGLLALWPSHLGYAMVLGDVVVERIEAELGGPGEFGGGLRPSDVTLPPPSSSARWDRDNFPWRDRAHSQHATSSEPTPP